MTGDLVSSPTPPGSDSGAAASRSGLRACLLIGVGCLAVLALASCIAAALLLPRLRTVVQDVSSSIGIDSLQDLENLNVPADLLNEVPIIPTESPDLCVEILCLSYPEGITFEAQLSMQPEQLEPDMWAVPAHSEIRFTGYPLVDTFHVPHLSIFEAERFRQVNPNAGPALDELSSLLSAQPAAPDSIPLLPVFNAAQMILTHVEYLTFSDGTGVRFVTQYGQGIWPINNHDLFYAFVGLSDDGQTLISAIMPISNPGLPDDSEAFIGDDYEGFAQGYAAYIESTKAMLDGYGPETFMPDLDDLDALMRSIVLAATH